MAVGKEDAEPWPENTRRIRQRAYVIDVKDAFLTVPQKNAIWVKVPSWGKKFSISGDALLRAENWNLLRCLPGQRNAALMWCNYFKEMMLSHGFESFAGMPTVFRHKERSMFLTKDFLLSRSLTTTLTMKSSGPHRVQTDDVLYYLKKKITMTPSGIFIQPNPSYIQKMVELLQLQGKKDKPLPHRATSEVYEKFAVKPEDCLTAEVQKVLRSGLGIALYIAQDRPDIQQLLKVLSTYMSGGTKLAFARQTMESCSESPSTT